MIKIRKQINVDITEYRRLVASYTYECKILLNPHNILQVFPIAETNLAAMNLPPNGVRLHKLAQPRTSAVKTMVRRFAIKAPLTQLMMNASPWTCFAVTIQQNVALIPSSELTALKNAAKTQISGAQHPTSATLNKIVAERLTVPTFVLVPFMEKPMPVFPLRTHLELSSRNAVIHY